MRTNPRTLPSTATIPVAGFAAAALFLGGCASPDPENEMDEFRSAALSDAGGQDTTASCGDIRPTPSGSYFCALSANLARDKPLYIYMTFTLDGETLTIDAQPLVRDLDEDDTTPMDDAREPIGDLLPQVVTEYGENGEFTIDWPGITILGDANPLTYRDLGGDLVLNGTFVTDDVAYGTMGGQVTNPTIVPLAGSNFACERTDDPASIDPVYYDADILQITPCAEGSGAGEGSGE